MVTSVNGYASGVGSSGGYDRSGNWAAYGQGLRADGIEDSIPGAGLLFGAGSGGIGGSSEYLPDEHLDFLPERKPQ